MCEGVLDAVGIGDEVWEGEAGELGLEGGDDDVFEIFDEVGGLDGVGEVDVGGLEVWT